MVISLRNFHFLVGLVPDGSRLTCFIIHLHKYAKLKQVEHKLTFEVLLKGMVYNFDKKEKKYSVVSIYPRFTFNFLLFLGIFYLCQKKNKA